MGRTRSSTSEAVPTSSTSAPAPTRSPGYIIGNRFTNANSSGGTTGFVGLIAGAQNAADINRVGDYLADKFGLTWTDVA